MDICEYAIKIWNLYLFGKGAEDVQKLLDMMERDVSIIGTGKHEFYDKRSSFAEALGKEGPEREEIEFKIQSISAKEQPVSDDVKLVTGGLHVIGKGRHVNVVVDMDTRYTLVFRREECRDGQRGDGGEEQWKLVHIHQSLPYIDQQEGEYYPKALMDQVDEANQRAAYLERLAYTDQLTGLLNHSAFYEKSGRLLAEHGGGFCMTVDLDDFKGINDTYGHHEGDAVLQKMGEILRRAAGESGVAGRVGGDEFALFWENIASGDEACAVAQEILDQADAYAGGGHVFPGMSIGISRVRDGEGLKEAFRRADEMLYKVKRSGKHGYRFCG